MQKDWQIVLAELSAPFADDEISWKPQVFGKDKTRALATAHIDARSVMDRLDAVVGPDNWSDEYEVVQFTRLDKGVPETTSGVICKLTVMGITKSDVGVPSDYEATKGAFSDALKRAGVKFGIARYLYSMPQNWYSWDQQKRGWAEAMPRNHWRLAGLTSMEPQYPPGVEVMTDVDFYQFYEEVRDFTLNLAEDDMVNLGKIVDGILDKTDYYHGQNDIVAKLNKAKEDKKIEGLDGYTIAGVTNLPLGIALNVTAYLMGARARLR